MSKTSILIAAAAAVFIAAEAGATHFAPVPLGDKVIARKRANLRVHDDDNVIVESKSRGWGRLDIEVEPDRARVYLDGRYIGRGDERREVRAGRHHISVRTSRHGEVSQTVLVRANRVTRVRLELD